MPAPYAGYSASDLNASERHAMGERDETCSGFSNYATFTVAVNIENRKPLADLVNNYVSLHKRALADTLASSASVQALMRQENVDVSKVNWQELADHLSTD